MQTHSFRWVGGLRTQGTTEKEWEKKEKEWETKDIQTKKAQGKNPK